MDRVEVSNDDLRSVRHARRELSELVELLERGKADKFVLTSHGRMQAVVVSFEAFARLSRGAGSHKLRAA
jgi:hypothetical protein